MKDIQYIQIFGERNSGTNFLFKTLEQNLVDVPEMGFSFGWKHGFTNRKKIQSTDTKQVLFICMFKDPYAWISSMHEKPHHAPQLYFMDFSDFIRSEWACYKGKNYQIRAKNLKDNPVLPEEEMMQERDPKSKQRFENVVHLRNAKNRNFLRLRSLTENIIYLKYEDFFIDPAKKLEEILSPYNLDLKNDFKVSNAYHGKSQKLVWDKKAFYQEKRYLEKYNEDDLKFVNNILDSGFESQLGYEIIETIKI